jgi:hypothetical protein
LLVMVAAVAAAVAVAVVEVMRGRGLHPFIKPRCNASCFGAVARGEDVPLRLKKGHNPMFELKRKSLPVRFLPFSCA